MYSWLLNNNVQLTLELRGSTYMWTFFNTYTVGPSYPWVGFTSSHSTKCKSKIIFSICDWESPDAEGQLYQCSLPFYVRDLIIPTFWYLWGSENSSSTDTKGWLKFWESQNLYAGFWLHGGCTPHPHSSRVNYIWVYIGIEIGLGR